MIQSVAVAVIIVAAVAYAAWRVRLIIVRHNDPCYGCKGCELSKMKRNRLKKQACEKKNEEKFG